MADFLPAIENTGTERDDLMGYSVCYDCSAIRGRERLIPTRLMATHRKHDIRLQRLHKARNRMRKRAAEVAAPLLTETASKPRAKTRKWWILAFAAATVMGIFIIS